MSIAQFEMIKQYFLLSGVYGNIRVHHILSFRFDNLLAVVFPPCISILTPHDYAASSAFFISTHAT